MSFSSVYQQSQDPTFRQRLAVALVEQSRYFMQVTAQDLNMSTERYAALNRFARSMRGRITQPEWLTRYALWVLLPDDGATYATDAQLLLKVSSVYLQLMDEPPPA